MGTKPQLIYGTILYTYDAVNRLTAESGPAGNFSYSYDANGSRLSDSGGSYTYSATSNRLTARHGHAVTTDAAGNITADGLGHTYVYNQRGYLSEARLNGVLLANYYYDYRGLRTRKVTTAAAPQGTQVVRFVYDEAGHLIEELGTSGAPIRTYVWRDDTPIAQIDHVPTRRIRYFATDHLNTPRAAMDETGKVIWRWESDAFGSTPANEDPDGDGVRTTVNLRFPGQYYDQETGLHYNWQRYYDPGSGQYIQSDRIGLRGGSFSTFAYVGGNPLSRIDPTGKFFFIPIIVAAIVDGGATSIIAGSALVVGGAALWMSSNRPPGAIDAERGAKEWGRNNDVDPDRAVDIFHGIKGNQKRKPGSKAKDNCSVNPDTGEVFNGQGDHIGDLGDGH